MYPSSALINVNILPNLFHLPPTTIFLNYLKRTPVLAALPSPQVHPKCVVALPHVPVAPPLPHFSNLLTGAVQGPMMSVCLPLDCEPTAAGPMFTSHQRGEPASP